jgi:PAS domain S-box-containing protein
MQPPTSLLADVRNVLPSIAPAPAHSAMPTRALKQAGVALAGGLVFFALALGSLAISRHSGPIATLWIPNAVAAAFLLARGPKPGEHWFIASLLIGSSSANLMADFPIWQAVGFACANMIEIAIAVFAMRHFFGPRLDMENLRNLMGFVAVGGIAATVSSSTIAMLVVSTPAQIGYDVWLGWFLTDSLGMIIMVPMILLAIGAFRRRHEETYQQSGAAIAERIAILSGGMLATIKIFYFSSVPLLFLIPPIVLLHAFRLGAFGTAICVLAISAIATGMTYAGYGPVNAATGSVEEQLIVLQCLMAASFFTGLPVAAILKGRERMMENLRDRENQLALLTENVTDAIFRYDLTGLCTFASPSVKEITGEDPSSFLGQRASSRMHPEARETILRAEQNLLSGASERERITYRRFKDDMDGRPVYLEANCGITRNRETGEPEGIMVSSRDVTDRVELERLLVRARRHAEDATRAKSDFLANMSHEIRTPMNGVLGFAELMLQSDLDEEQERQVQLIVESGRSMMMLLNDILDLAKIEAGQIVIDHQPLDLSALVADCAQLHRATAQSKGLQIAVTEYEDPLLIMSDGQRLRQIILNLIGNAVKFTKQGKIEIGCEVEHEVLKIRVRDSGIGIAKDRLESIFDPFVQEENITARRFGGTGLGLSICRELAELLDGYIDVESELGVGTCFVLTLPYNEAAELPDEPRRPSPQMNAQSANLPPASHILLVEDHEINRTLVRTMLERCGQKVSTAYDGHQAISRVLEAQMHSEQFDLVLMDIQMPGCDGYEATRIIRSEGLRADQLPIIALSANAFPEDIAASRDAGMQAHIAKPLVFDELLEILKRWLPTRIVDDEDVDAPPSDAALIVAQDSPSLEADPSVNRTRLEEDFRRALEPGDHSPSPALKHQWQQRRTEALEAVATALRAGQLTGCNLEDLIRMVHNLAGTAGLFGEDDLGDKAAAFERALRSGVESEVREKLAKDLLRAA